jgi:membrane protein implicated in regulation of membrane protease activity
VLVPATLAWPALVTVSKSGPAAAVAATPSTPKFLSFAAAYLCAAIVVWRRWFRRRTRRAHRPGAAESFVGPA